MHIYCGTSDQWHHDTPLACQRVANRANNFYQLLLVDDRLQKKLGYKTVYPPARLRKMNKALGNMAELFFKELRYKGFTDVKADLKPLTKTADHPTAEKVFYKVYKLMEQNE